MVRNRLRFYIVFIATLLLMTSCRGAKVNAEVVELNAAVPAVGETAVPSPVRTAVPEESSVPIMDGVPTVTPKITFVPVSSYDSDNRNPNATPTPEWATPFPSPAGAPLVDFSDIGTGVVAMEDQNLWKKPSFTGKTVGAIKAGDILTVLDEVENGYHVALNGNNGYIPKQEAEVVSLSLEQKGLIRIKTASLNIHGAQQSTKIQMLADYIRGEDPDIIGIQEAKINTINGNGINWIARLSELTGLRFYSFCSTVKYDGGLYGTAILSRYPIIKEDNWKLDGAPGKEPRHLAYACVLTENGPVHFFNTHLCASQMHLKSINIASMVYYLRASGIRTFLVTGDFNCSPPRIARYMKDIHFANMDMTTFGDGDRIKIIDNILYTDGIVVADVHLADTDVSDATDHEMVVCDCYFLPDSQTKH